LWLEACSGAEEWARGFESCHFGGLMAAGKGKGRGFDRRVFSWCHLDSMVRCKVKECL
jgi:hypothetical protein